MSHFASFKVDIAPVNVSFSLEEHVKVTVTTSDNERDTIAHKISNMFYDFDLLRKVPSVFKNALRRDFGT